MKHPLLVQPHFWQWLSQDDHSCSDKGGVCLDLYRRECGWDEHMSPNVGIPEYYDNEQYARRMRTKRLMKKQVSNNKRNSKKRSGKQSSRTTTETNNARDRIYETVSKTFGFEHHEGTDRSLELRILKFVLIREGFVAKLWHHAQRLNDSHVDNKDHFRAKSSHRENENNVLAILSECRRVSTDLIMSLVAWRHKPTNTTSDKSVLHHEPFIWRSQKYVLKMCRDLNFISECEQLVEMLNTTKQRMINNPLMLPNNIDEATNPKAWFETSPPAIPLTKEDTKFKDKRKLKERTLQRQAEAALVLELYYEDIKEAMGESFWDKAYSLIRSSEDSEKLETECKRGQAQKKYKDEKVAITSARERKLLQWYGKAQAQLASLSHPSAAFSDRKSRGLQLNCDVESNPKGKEIPKEIVCFQTPCANKYSTAFGHRENESSIELYGGGILPPQQPKSLYILDQTHGAGASYPNSPGTTTSSIRVDLWMKNGDDCILTNDDIPQSKIECSDELEGLPQTADCNPIDQNGPEEHTHPNCPGSTASSVDMNLSMMHDGDHILANYDTPKSKIASSGQSEVLPPPADRKPIDPEDHEQCSSKTGSQHTSASRAEGNIVLRTDHDRESHSKKQEDDQSIGQSPHEIKQRESCQADNTILFNTYTKNNVEGSRTSSMCSEYDSDQEDESQISAVQLQFDEDKGGRNKIQSNCVPIGEHLSQCSNNSTDNDDYSSDKSENDSAIDISYEEHFDGAQPHTLTGTKEKEIDSSKSTKLRVNEEEQYNEEYDTYDDDDEYSDFSQNENESFDEKGETK